MSTRSNSLTRLLLATLVLIVAGCADPVEEWQEALEADSIEVYRAYAERYPRRAEAEQAARYVSVLKEWEATIRTDTLAAYRAFLEAHPNSTRRPEAEERLWPRAVEAAFAAWPPTDEGSPSESPDEALDEIEARRARLREVANALTHGDVPDDYDVADWAEIEPILVGVIDQTNAAGRARIEQIRAVGRRAWKPFEGGFTSQMTLSGPNEEVLFSTTSFALGKSGSLSDTIHAGRGKQTASSFESVAADLTGAVQVSQEGPGQFLIETPLTNDRMFMFPGESRDRFGRNSVLKIGAAHTSVIRIAGSVDGFFFGWRFESSTSMPLVFVLTADHGLVHLAGSGYATASDGKRTVFGRGPVSTPVTENPPPPAE